jgi:microsomal dipeptidase-like Zn-dependent dipeptidase
VGIGSDFDGIGIAPERDIRKIMGENFLHVVRQVVGY